jgi:OOP family OmpA-OmpF porin
MKKILKVLIAASAVAVVAAASAQTKGVVKDVVAKKGRSAYVQDQRGVVARNATGLCWHTGYWTPADSLPGCDGPLTRAVAKAAKAAPVAPVAGPASEKVTYAADALFDFDKAVVKPAGKEKLDDLVSKLKGLDLEVVVATGHTDSIGADKYNQKLSERRAEAVKAYLVSKGIDPKKVYTEGKGEKQPVASNKTKAGRAKNRRVEIEVVAKKG